MVCRNKTIQDGRIMDRDVYKRQALECKSSLEDAMRVLRGYCDTAEGIVPKAEWPMPDYTELLHKM